MSKISVSVTDGTNVNLTVSPRPVQTITVSRGSATQGTVTQVTANTPLSVTNGTTTPDLSIAQANGSTAGYLTAGDWSAFNSKVSTVSGTAPVTVTGSSNAIVSMAAATDSVSGYLTSTDHATFNAKVGSITSADGSIMVTGTITRDLSVTSSPNVIVEVRNNTGATLTKGTAVYINGAIGQLPTVTKAQANTDAASAQTLGLMTTDLANNANGYVTIIGLITNINTSAYTDGQQLYLSPTIAGGLTATKPQAPQHLVYVAVVEHAHITQGKLFVKVQNGYELDELHDVQITSPANGQTLTYDSATSLWKNTTPAASGVTSVSGTGTVSGISLSGTVTSTGSLTLGGSLNLSSPPVIGGTTPNTITGTTVTGSTIRSTGDIKSQNYGVNQPVYSLTNSGVTPGLLLDETPQGFEKLTISASTSVDASANYNTTGISHTFNAKVNAPEFNGVVGGTTPNTITGTVITAKDVGTSAFVIDDSNSTGVTCTFNIDQTTYNPTISATDGSTNYPLQLDTGLYVRNGSWLQLSNTGNSSIVYIKAPTSFTTYYLTLPTTTGSNNQVLKTDGTGVLSWKTVDPLTLTGISDPTAPSNTNTTIYSKSFGGYATLAGRNALNTSFGLQSALWSKNIQMWTTTAATAGSWLNASGTGNGTHTNVNPTTGGTLYQTVRRSTYANVITTTNQTLGIINGQASFFRGNAAGQGGYFFYARCGFDVWTNGGRFFAGMSQAATVVTANATSTNNTAGFAVEDTDAGAISFVTRSGAASTKTAVGLTITSNKGYDCYIYCSPNDTKITWQIIDINTGTSVTGTANTNLPTNTFMTFPLVLASNAALTPATSISLGVAKIYVESDY